MEIKKILKFNTLFYIYIFLQILVVFFGGMEDHVVGSSINIIDINYAIIIHISTLIIFSLGYLPISKQHYLKYSLIKKKKILFEENTSRLASG